MSDLKFAFRQLMKNPGFAVVAVLTLALGIGANTAMFSVVHAVLLRPLPFHEPDRLVWIENSGMGGMSAITTRVDNFLEWRSQNQSFEKLGAYFAFFDYSRYTLTGTGEPQRLRGVGISENFLDVLGVKPMLGRSFVEEECVWNGRKAAILSHSFWRQRFASDPAVVGRSITLNGDPTEIVGVMPQAFDFDAVFSPGMNVELLMPFPLVEETARWGNTIFGIGRLKPSVTIAQAQAEFGVINGRVQAANPQRGSFGARMTSLEQTIRGRFRSAFLILSGAVACVLLIACANLSNLLLARANARRKELAVRVALGAGRWRLVRQALTESLLLALCGCLLGAPLAFATVPSLSSLEAFSIPLLQTAEVDRTVLLFTALISCLAGLLCAVLPVLQISSRDTSEHLNESSHRGSAGRQSAAVRNGLVIAEVAVACMLLVGAGLLIRSFIGLLEVNPGFQPRKTAVWRLDPTISFPTLADGNRYYDRLVETLEALPGIDSAGLTDTLPLGRNRQWGVAAKGETYKEGQYPSAFPRIVDHRYLQTMRIPLRAGRYFDARDVATTEPVIIINETMARTLWPGRDAVGRFVQGHQRKDWKVIGVVGDVRHGGLDEAAQAEMYYNFRQTSDWNAIELVVRSSRPEKAFVRDVQAAIKTFDPNLPATEVTTLGEIVDRTVAPRRLIAELLGIFSALGLILASLGLYGVIAYSVSQRTREIGVRMALGAQGRDVLGLVMAQGAKLTIIGIAIGLVSAFALTRVVRGLLFGIGPTDPLTFMAIPVVFIVIALAACWLPARQAARTDPMEALRYE